MISPSKMDQVKALASEAADRAMEIYEENFDVKYKKDDRESPLTEADTESNRIITAGLKEITPEIPIISEETEDNKRYAKRRQFDEFWLVDPLDGTKEFVNKNGEFTVNIGLVRNTLPIAGVVVAPVPDVTYWTDGKEAKVERDGTTEELSTSDTTEIDQSTLVHSRSHSGEKMEEFLNEVTFGDSKPRGSSLKICNIAEGTADVYVRFRPTWEWDTAAADAVLRMAGGKFTEPDGNTLSYNTESLKNDRGLLVTNDTLHEAVSQEIVELFGESKQASTK
ncbi:MAG: 3'(2'),5'-bisphosphate nucleotidase CysQ [bacterium]